MELEDVIFQGPSLGQVQLLRRLPGPLSDLLQQLNGFVAYGGGLHVRGICREPLWHSLEEVWQGGHALCRLFSNVRQADVPFAQDCLGDQFLMRGESVVKLSGETGAVKVVSATLSDFFDGVERNPVGFLGLQPLLRFKAEGGALSAGELLLAFPPFCAAESAKGVALKAVSALSHLEYLSDLARQVGSLPSGSKIRFKVEP